MTPTPDVQAVPPGTYDNRAKWCRETWWRCPDGDVRLVRSVLANVLMQRSLHPTVQAMQRYEPWGTFPDLPGAVDRSRS